MGTKTISSGITLVIPTSGTTNWASILDTAFTAISSHDHSGGGNGTQLSASAFGANAVTGAKFRLDNDEYLRGRNNANSADIDIVKVTTADEIRVGDFITFNNTDLTPDTDGALDLGTTSKGWGEIHISDATDRYQASVVSGQLKLVAGTADAADNRVVGIGGGGDTALDGTRGAAIQLEGNEATNAGRLTLFAGNLGVARFGTTGAFSAELYSNNAKRFEVDSSGHFLPAADSTHNLGSTTLQFAAISTDAINVAAGTTLLLQQAGVTKFQLDASGNFSPGTTNTDSLGSSSLQFAESWFRAISSTGADFIVGTDSNHDIHFKTNAVTRLEIDNNTGRLAFATDNTYDFGASTLNAQSIWSRAFKGAGGTVSFGSGDASSVNFLINNSNVMTLSGSGHWLPATDNTYDLGSSAAAFRNIYFETKINFTGTAKNYDYNAFAFTPRTSLDPSAATASDCAEAINTIAQYLVELGLLTDPT